VRAQDNIELEIRFQRVDYYLFEAVRLGLIRHDINVEDLGITQSVEALMPNKKGGLQNFSGGTQKLDGNVIRQIMFENGVKKSTVYHSKTPIDYPVYVQNRFAMSYKVALSLEKDADEFSIEAGAIVRVKARASFLYSSEKDQGWRIDLTVVRQMTGHESVTTLQPVVKHMFRTPAKMTAENMLDVLNISESPISHQGYTFEIEIEYVGEPKAVGNTSISKMANLLLQISNPRYLKDAAYQAEIYYAASRIISNHKMLSRFEHDFKLKNLVPQAVSLTRNQYSRIYPPTGMYLSDKADGLRAIVTFRDGFVRVISDDLYEFVTVDVTKNWGPQDLALVDGEMIKGAEGAREISVYVFDVVFCAGVNVGEMGFEKRVLQLEDAAAQINTALAGMKNSDGYTLKMYAKPFVRLSGEPGELETQILTMYNRDAPYTTDGLIIVGPNARYDSTVTHKWKELRNNTIDFMAKIAPKSVHHLYEHKKDFVLYFLFSSIQLKKLNEYGIKWCPGYKELFEAAGDTMSGSYVPIQFCPSDTPLAYVYYHPAGSDPVDGKVVEMRCTGECDMGFPPNWEIVRIREDRAKEIATGNYFGNDFKFAELIWLNYIDPFPLEELYGGAGAGAVYFAKPKSGIYYPQTTYVSFVKGKKISEFAGLEWVIDVGAGKGQDLKRYYDAKVHNLVAVDSNRNALAQLIAKKGTLNVGKRAIGVTAEATRQTSRRRAEPADAAGPADSANSVEPFADRHGRTRGTAIYIVARDVTDPYEETLAAFRRVNVPVGSVDAIFCSLTIHYFLESDAKFDNFVSVCREVLGVGGKVVIVCLSGEKVHEKLRANNIAPGESWNLSAPGPADTTPRYTIRRDYTDDALTNVGQKIAVRLPFSAGELYEEYLVNTQYVITTLAISGIAVADKLMITEYMDEFKSRFPSVASMMIDIDREYLDLFWCATFQKIPPSIHDSKKSAAKHKKTAS